MQLHFECVRGAARTCVPLAKADGTDRLQQCKRGGEESASNKPKLAY
jgi:hypothetical protein